MTNVAKLPVNDFVFVAHPLANSRHGILEPIRLYQGMILDGRNRYKAASEVRHQFTEKDFVQWDGTPAEPEAWVISINFHRRQLTNAQKQEIIQDMIKKNPELGDREIARRLLVAHSTVGAARDRLANSSEVRQYAEFLKRWDKLSDDQCREFVKENASDIRLFLNEIAASPSS